jgi:hypothetical protein
MMAAVDADTRVTPLGLVAAAFALAALGYGVSQTVDWLQVQGPRGRVADATQHTFSCLEQRLHRLVPAGTKVAIGPNSSLYQQRLVEWSTPSLTVVADQRQASAVLLVRHVHGGCNGLDVSVRRPA